MRTLKFKDGGRMPIIGLGTWKSEPGKVKEAVKDAIEIGYRHIDCAAIYGNETEIGEALTECMEAGTVTREELWITSKLWNDSHRQEDVKSALEKSLSDLNLDYLDLYLIHWPVALEHGTAIPKKTEDFIPLEEVPIIETWRGMEELKAEGLVRHIGVSNFSENKLVNLLAVASEMPEVNQVELHPYLQQQELVNFCQGENIIVTAYSPLGSQDRPDDMKKNDEPVPMENTTIAEIADKYGCTEAQVLIAWALARNTAVIPKSTNAARIRENYEARNIELDNEDMLKIRKLNKGYRFVDASFFEMDGNSYTPEQIWDEDIYDVKEAAE